MFGLMVCEEFEDTTNPIIDVIFVWKKTEGVFNFFGRIILCSFVAIWFSPITVLCFVFWGISKMFCILFRERGERK
jgi:hypothetical protein